MVRWRDPPAIVPHLRSCLPAWAGTACGRCIHGEQGRLRRWCLPTMAPPAGELLACKHYPAKATSYERSVHGQKNP
ncbi:unnamed protein product [Musa textilis]